MGYKSQPEGWINPICFGDCVLKDTDECIGCRMKSKYKSPPKRKETAVTLTSDDEGAGTIKEL